MEGQLPEWNGIFGTLLGAGGLGALIGVVGTIVTALINRQPPLAAVVDARIRVLIEGYERRVTELQQEVARLEAKVDALTRALAAARLQKGWAA